VRATPPRDARPVTRRPPPAARLPEESSVPTERRLSSWRLPSLALAAAILISLASPAPGRAQPRGQASPPGPATAPYDVGLLDTLQYRNIGPAITGGRMVEFAVVEADPRVIYAATASGGAFKTVNGGGTWQPVFDRETSVSIGAMALSQKNPNIVWIGTGEANQVRSSSWGDGVYKSEDGGRTWQHMGLEKSQHVGRVLIHPDDPDTVYVAALGALWGSNEERGLYKTTDGGRTWEKILFISKYTGVVDVVMDPRDPDVLYAAAFQRERRYYSFLGGGPEGGVFKSTDAGRTWQPLTNGLAKGPVGRIGLAVCLSQPDRLYAAVVGPDGGIFLSNDRGASWEKRTSRISTHWFYGQIECDPKNPNRVFVPMTRHYVSEDAGRTFRDDFARAGVHADHHTIWINPHDPTHMLLGTDGGIYITRDDGATWDFQDHLSITQFYTVAVDMQEPFYYVYGGTQDNSTWGGPSGTRNTDGIVNADWYLVVGGDGFYAQIDPTDATVVYGESQYGNLSRFDTRTGERRFIQPQSPDGEKYRWNWSAPLVISPHDHKTLYIGANYLFKSTNRGDTWARISPDLSRQVDEWTLPLQDKVQPDDAIDLHASTADYGNITSISESAIRPGLLAVGTDDGLVHVSRDDGQTWLKCETFPGVPEQTRVSRIAFSRFAEGTVYVSFDGHQDNDFRPFVLRSTDYGRTWTSIAANLPSHGSVHVVAEHPGKANLLFVGTEFGLFFSIDDGRHWMELKNNLPTVAVHDLVVHPRENDLVLGTHGRGFWILDDIGVLEGLTSEVVASGSHLFPVRRGWQFNRFNRGRGATGQQRFIAPNPPDGSIVTYFATQGERVELDVLDGAGTVIRRLVAGTPASRTGVFRTSWDLRYAPPLEQPGRSDDEEGFFAGPRGAFVLPGEYHVRLRVGGTEHRQMVSVLADPLVPLTDQDRRLWHDTLLALAGMHRTARGALSIVERTATDLRTIRDTLSAHPGAEALLAEHQTVAAEVQAITRLLRGTPPRGVALTPGPPALAQRIQQLYGAVNASTGVPTTDQAYWTRRSHEQLTEVVTRVNRLIGETLPALHRQLDQQNITWTSGRPLALAPLALPRLP
jgi:photosystem II stability/assembly factor-like uncharacterized protein